VSAETLNLAELNTTQRRIICRWKSLVCLV